jgi:protein CpxP
VVGISSFNYLYEVLRDFTNSLPVFSSKGVPMSMGVSGFTGLRAGLNQNFGGTFMKHLNSFGVRLAAVAFTAVLGFAICTGTAFSQDDQAQPATPPAQGGMGGHGMHGGHHGMPSAEEQTQRLTKKLNLSDDQQTKVKAVLEDQHKQMETLHNDSSTAQPDKRSKMREIHENSNTQIKAILNPDQQKKFDEMEQKQQERMHDRQAPPNDQN